MPLSLWIQCFFTAIFSFFFQIETGSIAAQNGRIREGDQILQINNEEINSRDQAIRLFSENANEVTVTIARHVFQV